MAQTCPSCGAENEDVAEVCFTCRSVLSAITQGSLIAGRYEVLKPIGRGGMGMVYKARDRVLDEMVALKLLRGDMAESPEMARRFRSEIKLARKVTHPNVCRIHDYGEDGRLRHISMELIEGIDLKRVLRQSGPLAPREAYQVAIQLADGLQAIHKVGIVHRDLKTPNIMRDAEGAVRLMDFGIAKSFAADGTTGATATGHIVGTPEYMSPEQARGDKVDARSDIYALGIVVFEIFTGDVPFRGDTPLATLLKHIHDPPPLAGPAAARLPPDLVPVLARILAKEPSDRFATAREVGSALREACARSLGFDVTAGPTAVLPRPDATPTTPIPAAVATPVPTPVPTVVPTAVGTLAAVPAQALPRAAAAGALVAPQGDASAPPTAKAPQSRSGNVARGSMPRPFPSRTPTALPVRRSREPGARAPRVIALVLVAASVVVLVVTWGAQRRPVAPAVPPAESSPIDGVTSAPTAPSPTPPSVVPADAPAPPPVTRTETPAPSLAAAATPRSAPVRPAAAPTLVPALPAPTTLAALPTWPGPSPSLSASSPAGPVPSPVPPSLQPATARTEGLPAPPAPAEASPSPVPENPGSLQLGVRPYADVLVDEKPVGTTPLARLRLPAGVHTIRLLHPDYEPFQRKVTIRPGETTKLNVNLELDGIRK